MIDPFGREDRVGMPGIGREFNAGDEENLGIALLDIRKEIEIRMCVVIGDHDEIETAREGELRDLIKRRRGVSALSGVDEKIAGIPAAPHLKRLALTRGAAARVWRVG